MRIQYQQDLYYNICRSTSLDRISQKLGPVRIRMKSGIRIRISTFRIRHTNLRGDLIRQVCVHTQEKCIFLFFCCFSCFFNPKKGSGLLDFSFFLKFAKSEFVWSNLFIFIYLYSLSTLTCYRILLVICTVEIYRIIISVFRDVL